MTPERAKKIQTVLSKKQLDLCVILENVDDPHNISAVLRSCDAVGIKEVYILDTKELPEKQLGKKSSASAAKWMDTHHCSDINECIQAVRSKYNKIYCTHLAHTAGSIYETDLCQSIAIVFGNEKDGVSETMLNHSDGNLIIPQVGMIQSLNISVACAVTLYEAFRQRNAKGHYDGKRNNPLVLDQMFGEWEEKHNT